ncbi:MAG TPA: nuclear transport factor 2 family protein [Alphaproteobacteria bacterium]|jgi:ketosteroid isomerase-like protein
MIRPEHKKAMTDYLDAFTRGDLNGVLSLFNENAVVISPTAGAKKPSEFYPILLERSKGTTFKMKMAFAGETPDTAAILFDYNKALPDGGTKTFDCVDIFTFDAAGKITEMKIIFDTKNLG